MNNDMPWVNLTQEEVEELRTKKQELTQYGKEKIRELVNQDIIVNMDGGVGGSWEVREQNPDEIVLKDVEMFHLHSMNERSLWIGVYTQDGKIYHLNISADGDKLSYWWSDEGSIKIGLTCNDENDLHGIVSQTKEERLLSTNSDLSQD